MSSRALSQVAGDTVLLDFNKALRVLADAIVGAFLSSKEFEAAIELLSADIEKTNNLRYNIKTRTDNYIPKIKRFQLKIAKHFFCPRLLLPISGYLPWRLRRKKKDK